MKACFKIVERRIFVPTSVDQACLNNAEYSRKSLVGKMYVIVNEQVKFLTSQYIGTCKSAYTKGYALN